MTSHHPFPGRGVPPVMKGHPPHARRACGPRAPRTAAAVVALSLLACATLVLVYRLGVRAGVQEADALRRSGAVVGANHLLPVDKSEFQTLLQQRILRLPRHNLWDERRPSASELRLEWSLRNAADADARARVLEEMVQSSYCSFQVVHGNSSTLREDLERLRLDRPMLLTGVMQPATRWTVEHFISGYDASANVTVITMPEGADALQYETSRPGDKLTKAGWLETEPEAIGAFAERCARGEARNLISTTNLIGTRFGAQYDPWLKPCAEACSSIAGAVEEAAWEAGIPQMYPIGPWEDSTRRLRGWVQHVQSAPSADERRARLRAFDQYYASSRLVDSDAYVRDALGLSAHEMRERWAAPETSFTSSPVLFMGGHLSGLHAHHHQRAVTVAANGYRVWYVRKPAREPKSMVPAFEHITNVASIRLGTDQRARGDALCTQPPGSMVILPDMWTHTIVGWAEDEHGRPAPLDQKTGMTVSLSYQ